MLGDISPQTTRLTAIPVVYPGRDHVVSVTIEKTDGRRYTQADLSAVTRAVLVFPKTSPVIAYDSLVDPVFAFGAGGVLEIDLSDYAMPASIYASYLVLFDAEHPGGQVLVDNVDSVLTFDFRNISTTGDTPTPVVEFITEAPIDGETYGRKDGAWVTLEAIVSGVVSVNGQTGVVTGLATDASVVDARFQSTGLISGGALSINGADNTKFDVASGIAVFADYTDPENSQATVLPFGPLSSITVTNLAAVNVSYVGINGAGSIVQQVSPFTNAQRRSIVSLGVVIHSNRTNINAINTLVSVNRQLLNQFGDGIRAIGQLNLSGNVYSAAGANLNIQKTGGELFVPGANFHINPDDPHSISLPSEATVTFRYRLADGTEYASRTTIDPENYDNAGVLTTVPNNRYTVQLIAVFQSGLTRIQYGQETYTQLSAAVAAAQAQDMILEANIAQNGVLRGYIVVKKGTTALNTADTVFISLSKFSAAAAVAPIALATTDELTEGSTNFYHTAARVLATVLAGLSTATTTAVTAADTILVSIGKLAGRLALKEQILTEGTNITIDRTDPEAPVISATGGGAVDSVNGQTGVVVLDTDDIAEGSTNLYHIATNIAEGTRTATTVLVTSSTGTDATLSAASITEAGVMAAADKSKLDGVATGANNYSHPNHSGDVTSVGDGAQTIAANAVTNAKAADMAVNTIKGRITAGTGDPEDLTATNVRTILNVANGATALAAVATFTGNKTLALADINTYNVSQDGTAQTVNLPAQATVAWTADAEIHIEQGSTGTVTVTGATGVAINGVSAGSFSLAGQYAVATLKRIGSNAWTLIGALASSVVTGPASAGDGNLALFDGTTGKVIKDGGVVTAAGLALLDDASAAAQATTLGLGTGNSPTFTALTLSNGQVVFPATQVPSANANTLDDYEEGTWTPVLTFATPGDLSVAYSIQSGDYEKIGRSVIVSARVRTSAFTHTTASGNLQVTGLPFTNTTPVYGGLSWQGITAAGYTDVSSVVIGTRIEARASASGSAILQIGVTHAPTGASMELNFNSVYR